MDVVSTEENDRLLYNHYLTTDGDGRCMAEVYIPTGEESGVYNAIIYLKEDSTSNSSSSKLVLWTKRITIRKEILDNRTSNKNNNLSDDSNPPPTPDSNSNTDNSTTSSSEVARIHYMDLRMEKTTLYSGENITGRLGKID